MCGWPATDRFESESDKHLTLRARHKSSRWKSRVTTAVLSLAAVMLLAAVWAFIEPTLLVVSRTTVTSPEVPSAFSGKRIVFVTDVHAGPSYRRERVARLVDTINNQRPHIVILGGDYVGGADGGAEDFYPEAARIDAPMGVLAVLGNHDGREGADVARSELASIGAVLLENQNARVRVQGAWIRVGGVADSSAGEPDVYGAARDIAKGEYAILVSHTPDTFARGLSAVPGAFDLALAGHTHAGQVTLFGLAAPWTPSAYGERYRQGWLEERGVPILVSRGVGTVYVPVRFFAVPEIHVIELRTGDASVVKGRSEVHGDWWPLGR